MEPDEKSWNMMEPDEKISTVPVVLRLFFTKTVTGDDHPKSENVAWAQLNAELHMDLSSYHQIKSMPSVSGR